MTAFEFIDQKVIEASFSGEDLTEITLDLEMYRQFMKEVKPLLVNYTSRRMITSKPVYNSMIGPIDIKCGKNRMDPNDIMKEIL